MKIGVFDSGIGGEAVARSLSDAFPKAEIITVNDRANVPYGSKPIETVISLTLIAMQPLIEATCDVIVIACNTATAAAIETLRSRYPTQLFVGLEPMVKPAAALSSSGVIGICATPATLQSERYNKLKQRYAQQIVVLEPDCHMWATMIEHDQVDELIIKNTIKDMIMQGADVIVLACTHYHWIRELIESVCDGNAAVLDPSEAIVKRIKSLLGLQKH